MVAEPVRVGAGVSLTAVTGFVDAVGYIELGGFFASFMSGASISIGVGMSESHWPAVQHAGFLIAAFVAAATTSSMISGMMRPWGLPTVLFLEAACLSGAVVMIETGWAPSAAIVPAVAAMGIQNTALRPLSGVRLGVTFMTGTLISLSQALGRSLIGRGRRWSWLPHGFVWCSFVAGAGAGALLYIDYGFVALVAPTLVAWGLTFLTAVSASTAARRRKSSKV
jgi:uncharacterized membrane protein YoaK (UPF0700 family)